MNALDILWVIYHRVHVSTKNISITTTCVNLAGIFSSIWSSKAFTHKCTERLIHVGH